MEALLAVPEEWSRLAEEARNPFGTREWIQTWWRHFGLDRESFVGIAQDESGAVQAIVPLLVWHRRPLRVARFIGHGPSDFLGPVYAPGDRDRAAEALAETLEAAGCDALLAERLPAGSPLPPGWRERALFDEPSPVLSLDSGSWDAFLADRSSNFRQQVRRRERNLSKRYDLSYRLTEDPAQLDADFDTLTRLHRLRWHEGQAGRFGGADLAFHRDFARVALERGWLRLWTMELDGRPVSCWYGLRFGGVEWYYQAGRDPAFDSDNVGFVLLAHTVREAISDGMDAYSFLRGDEPYKDRFGPNQDRVRTSVAGRGLRGRAVALAGAGANRLPAGVRRRAIA